MIEITENQYNVLRENGDKYCGRVFSWERKSIVIYYAVEDGELNQQPLQLLRELAVSHPITEGEYDVFRHWDYPEVTTINYTVL